MNYAITPFVNKDLGEVRVATIEGEPYFLLKDVCRTLGISRTWNAVAKLREEAAESRKAQDVGPCTTGPRHFGVRQLEMQTRGNGGIVPMTFIDEPNLYSVILQSRKPEALKFKRWIVEDAIPSIRKTGGYLAKNPRTYVEALEAHHEVLGKLIVEVKRREQLDRTS